MATAAVDISQHGAQEADSFDRQWYDYVVDGTVATGAQLQIGLQIQTDADFEWWWTTLSRTNGLLKLLIEEVGTGRQFIGTSGSIAAGAGTFQGVNVDNFAGMMTQNAAFPLAIPFVLPASRTYKFTLTDGGSGANNVFEIVLRGFKLWPKQGAIPASGRTSQAGGIQGF